MSHALARWNQNPTGGNRSPSARARTSTPDPRAKARQADHEAGQVGAFEDDAGGDRLDTHPKRGQTQQHRKRWRNGNAQPPSTQRRCRSTGRCGCGSTGRRACGEGDTLSLERRGVRDFVHQGTLVSPGKQEHDEHPHVADDYAGEHQPSEPEPLSAHEHFRKDARRAEVDHHDQPNGPGTPKEIHRQPADRELDQHARHRDQNIVHPANEGYGFVGAGGVWGLSLSFVAVALRRGVAAGCGFVTRRSGGA